MRIAILGAGAMGTLYGGYLSQHNEVILVDRNAEKAEAINKRGVQIHEMDGSVTQCFPRATVHTEKEAPADVVVLFVKAMFSRDALEKNRSLIGPGTYLMTLQNGGGHETLLAEYADREHVIIGTTQHNASVVGFGEIRHGGVGKTCIGLPDGGSKVLAPIADAFSACGLETVCEDSVQRLIWGKLFTNASASVLTGILQVPLGYIAENTHAWTLCEKLVREAVDVAAGDGILFDADEKVEEVRKVCTDCAEGRTSIYADLRDGRKTEVDTISGSVVRASRRNGVPAPTHEAMVTLVHAMEGRV